MCAAARFCASFSRGYVCVHVVFEMDAELTTEGLSHRANDENQVIVRADPHRQKEEVPK